MARELLSDFREVDHNFRGLDRRVRERIPLWQGSKGALLEEIMGERDAISDSDQRRSFRVFWDFLMSSRRQGELSELFERVLALPLVIELKPDSRTRRVHYDWLENIHSGSSPNFRNNYGVFLTTKLGWKTAHHGHSARYRN